MDNIKELSKRNYSIRNSDSSVETINTGCLQRIADSLEKIEEPYKKLQDSNEYLRSRHQQNLARIATLEKQAAAYKGLYNKLKNKK